MLRLFQLMRVSQRAKEVNVRKRPLRRSAGFWLAIGTALDDMRWFRTPFEDRKRSQRRDSNPRPAVYETAALPLSYAGP